MFRHAARLGLDALGAPGGEHEVDAFGGEGFGDGQADADAAAGDDGHFIFESKVHSY